MKISIEGNISSGKSSVLLEIQKAIRLPVFLEPIESWTLLGKFYEDPSRWALAFNSEVLLSMYKFKDNNYDSLYERSPNSCRHVFTQLQYEQNQMTKEELGIFDKLYNTFGWDQDVIIYIRTDPEVCFERMKQRNRECENEVSLEYLKDLARKHDDMISYLKEKKPNIRIFTVNGNEDKKTVFENVLSMVTSF
jgi:deoxyadenosine/deoxycytidine kinase